MNKRDGLAFIIRMKDSKQASKQAVTSKCSLSKIPVSLPDYYTGGFLRLHQVPAQEEGSIIPRLSFDTLILSPLAWVIMAVQGLEAACGKRGAAFSATRTIPECISPLVLEGLCYQLSPEER